MTRRHSAKPGPVIRIAPPSWKRRTRQAMAIVIGLSALAAFGYICYLLTVAITAIVN